MRIFITNDDGVSSRGIEALWNLALEFADEVMVLAPNTGFSGMSHAITMNSPLYVDKVIDEVRPDGKKLTVYSTNGSPVDCVKLALDDIWKGVEFDLVLSGINHGSNNNISVIYSGTMGAAMEGAFYKIPSIGFSLYTHDTSADLSAVVHYGREIIKKAIALPALTPTLCWNVNVPTLPLSEIKGVEFTRQSKGVWFEEFDSRVTPHGKPYKWMNGAFHNYEPEATDNDEYFIHRGYVTIVPVQIDMTDYKFLESEYAKF